MEPRDKYGQTPSSLAAEQGHEAVTRLLLEEGAELESKDTVAETPLFRAVKIALKKEVSSKELWLENFADEGIEVASTGSERSGTSLTWAVKRDHKPVVELLLNKGAEVESKDASGKTPLDWAVETGREAAFKSLIS